MKCRSFSLQVFCSSSVLLDTIPPICTCMMAAVFGVVLFTASAASRHMSSPQSAKTGMAPAFKIAFALAMNVFAGRITSLPATFRARQMSSSAEVPLLHPTACLVPMNSANFFSNSPPYLCMVRKASPRRIPLKRSKMNAISSSEK